MTILKNTLPAIALFAVIAGTSCTHTDKAEKAKQDSIAEAAAADSMLNAAMAADSAATDSAADSATADSLKK